MKTAFFYNSKAMFALFLAFIITLVLAASACNETRVEYRYAGIDVPVGGKSPNAYYIMGDEASPITTNISISVYEYITVKDITAAFFTNTENNASNAAAIASTQVAVPNIAAGQNHNVTITFTPPTDQLGTFYYFPGITQTYEQVTFEDGNEVGRQWATGNFHAQPPIIIEVLTQEEFERRGIEQQEEQIQETLYAGDLYLTIVRQPQNTTYQQLSGYFDGLEILIDTSAWRKNTVYQWYSNTEDSATGGTAIANTNSPFHRPPTDTIGTTYYYCEVSVTDDVNTLNMTSNVVSLTVKGPEVAPTLQITGQPQGGSYEQNSYGAIMAVDVDSNMPQGNITYQWYSNTQNATTGGTAINGANSSAYRAPDSAVGTTYYYCVVNATNGEDTVTQTSNAAAITITPTSRWEFTIQQQPQNGTYNMGDTAQLSISAYVSDNRALSYQWYTSLYSGIDGMNNSVAILGANASTFSINTSGAYNQYYYCVVSDAYGNYRTSNLVNVVVVDPNPAPPPPPPPINIWVAGIQVTHANAADVLGDGTNSVYYNTETNVLTVDFDKITHTSKFSTYALAASTGSIYKDAVIGANQSFTLNLINGQSGGVFAIEHDNFNNKAAASAIHVVGDLTITGNFGVGAHMNLLVTGSNASGLDVTGNLIVSTASGTQIEVKGADGAYASGESGKDGMVIGGTATRTAGAGTFTAYGGYGDSTASGGNGAVIGSNVENDTAPSGTSGGIYTLP